MKNVLALAATSALLLSACASTGTTDPSAAPEPAKNFCDAMGRGSRTACGHGSRCPVHHGGRHERGIHRRRP